MININMSCAVIADDSVFFSALDYNALFRMDLLSGKTEYVCKFERERKLQSLHVKAFIYKKQIWFIPLYGEFIARFSINKNKMDYFEIPMQSEGKLGKDTFWLHTQTDSIRPRFLDAGRIDEERIFLVPATSDTVIILDMKTGNIKPYYGVVDVEQEFIGSGAICGDKLWMAPYIGNQLIGLDIESGEVERVKCPHDLGVYFGMCSFANRLYFSPQNKKYVLHYDTIIKKFEKLSIDNEKIKNASKVSDNMYRDAVSSYGKVWLLPTDSEMIICIDPIKETSFGVYPPEGCDFGILITAEIDKDELFVMSYSYGYMMSIDHKSNLTVFERASIDENEFHKIHNGELSNGYLNRNQFIHTIPEDKLGLLNYIRAVTNK